MTIQQAWQQLATSLKELYDERESANIANAVIEYLTGYNRVDRIVHKHDTLNEERQVLLLQYLQQLLQHKPVQYVLHEAWFYGLKFYVDENVLIPRPETEELVEFIAGQSTKTSVHVLDIGTGSGCIPIALKNRFPSWDVHGVDISTSALAVAKKNAAALNVNASFHQLDILNIDTWPQLPVFDIIVSNPPYILESEAGEMRNNVVRFEPHTALFVPEADALVFYRYITQFAMQHLTKGGLLFFEINEALGKDVCGLLEAEGFTNVTLKKDFQGKDRMIRATLVKN